VKPKGHENSFCSPQNKVEYLQAAFDPSCTSFSPVYNRRILILTPMTKS
jgi:hypothetical protein